MPPRAVYIDCSDFVLDLLSADEWASVQGLHVHLGDPAAAALPALIVGASGVMNGHTMMDERLLRGSPALRSIVFLGTGASSYIDMDAARELRHSGAHGARLRGPQRRRTRIRPDARGRAACRGDGSRAARRRVGSAHRDRAGRKMPRHHRDRGNRARLGTHGGRVRHARAGAGTARRSPRICPAVRLAWTICCDRPMSSRCILR